MGFQKDIFLNPFHTIAIWGTLGEKNSPEALRISMLSTVHSITGALFLYILHILTHIRTGHWGGAMAYSGMSRLVAGEMGRSETWCLRAAVLPGFPAVSTLH